MVLELRKEGVEFALETSIEAGGQKCDQNGKREFAVMLKAGGIDTNRFE